MFSTAGGKATTLSTAHQLARSHLFLRWCSDSLKSVRVNTNVDAAAGMVVNCMCAYFLYVAQ
jgi:hypothetical protein